MFDSESKLHTTVESEIIINNKKKKIMHVIF